MLKRLVNFPSTMKASLSVENRAIYSNNQMIHAVKYTQKSDMRLSELIAWYDCTNDSLTVTTCCIATI